MLTIFHGSLTHNIKKFNVCTHFGSREQAITAIGAHRFFDNLQGNPIIYKCNFDEKLGKTLEMTDWGSPNVQAAYYYYCKSINDMETFNKKVVEVRKMESKDENKIYRDLLYASATAEGIIGAHYMNTSEGTGASWCIYQPATIKLIETEFPTWSEIATHFITSTKQGQFGFGQKGWDEACERAKMIISGNSS